MAAHCAAAERHVLIKKKESTAAFIKVFRYTSCDLISQSKCVEHDGGLFVIVNNLTVIFCRVDPTATTLVTTTTLSDHYRKVAITDGKANNYYMSYQCIQRENQSNNTCLL